jgi:hypothetical protein
VVQVAVVLTTQVMVVLHLLRVKVTLVEQEILLAAQTLVVAVVVVLVVLVQTILQTKAVQAEQGQVVHLLGLRQLEQV